MCFLQSREKKEKNILKAQIPGLIFACQNFVQRREHISKKIKMLYLKIMFYITK